MGSLQQTGLWTVDFRRSILPKDAHDAPIAIDEPTQVIVAIGSNRPRGIGSYQPQLLETENTTINFSSDETEVNCPDINIPLQTFDEPKPEEAWKKGYIKNKQLLLDSIRTSGR